MTSSSFTDQDVSHTHTRTHTISVAVVGERLWSDAFVCSNLVNVHVIRGTSDASAAKAMQDDQDELWFFLFDGF